MRALPFFKPKNKPQFAGLNVSDASSGGGGGGGDTSSLVNKSDITPIILIGTTNTSGDVISTGTWFYLNGKPCVAKVDIASGATFTEGTNYEEKTVGSALSELNSKIGFYLGGIVQGNSSTDVNLVPIHLNGATKTSNFLVSVAGYYGYGALWMVNQRDDADTCNITPIVAPLSNSYSISAVSRRVVRVSAEGMSGNIFVTAI